MLIISIKLSKVKSQDNLTDFGQKRPWPLMSNMNSNECDLPSTVFTCWFPWLNLEKQKSKPAFVHESLPDYRQRIIIQPFSNERLLKKKIDYSFQSTHHSYLHGNGHIAWIHSITGLQPHHIEMPVPMWWPKLSSVEPGHYLVGWLLGNIRWMCRNMKLITTWN